MAEVVEQKTEEQSEFKGIGSVLVVGAGIAGIRAAIDLAEAGYRVVVSDASPAIGGILSKLDYQFPNDHCGMCKMLPLVGREYASQYCMRKSLSHDNIKIMPFTEVVAVRGEPGAFEVQLLERARHVDTEVCIGTGYCAEVCPIGGPDEFNQGLTRRKAIYQPVPHNLPNMWLIDMSQCDKCAKCVEVCPVDAIKLDAEDRAQTIQVDAIILAAGSGLYDPSSREDLSSYARSPDVVTSLQFERLLSGSGRYDGAIRRTSDGKPAKRIAWMQCVGSRNRVKDRDHCSSICCMFALKEAVLAHDKGGEGVQTTIFYMDMRTFGKDFYRYREQAEEQHGVRLVRCRVHTVDLLQDGCLQIRYQDPSSGQWRLEPFDMVVLSTGQERPTSQAKLAQLLGVEPGANGFFSSPGFEKVRSVRPGVFMCGSFTGLTDISEALIGGSAAASEASKLLAEVHRPFKAQEAMPEERAVGGEKPRVHVILCRWNHGKMPQGIDIEKLALQLRAYPGVGQVDVVQTLCRGDGYEEAGALLLGSTCNRIVFGACLPYVYRQRLRTLARRAGLSASLVEVVDLRSIIQRHLAEKDEASLIRKLKQSVIVGVEKLKAANVLGVRTIPITQRALIVGAGIAGMRAALSLANRGISVDLVERTNELGGRTVKRLHYTLDGLDPRGLVQDLKQAVWEHKRITLHKNATVISCSGSLGKFRTVIKNGEEAPITIEHGAAILATGGQQAGTSEYAYGTSDRVLTQAEVEEKLAGGTLADSSLDTVVMIQCVGSRERGAHEYCSRVCCAAALKNAFRIRATNPDARIIILYRDMMTYGFLEQYYTKARGEGIVFAAYELGNKPKVEIVNDKPVITFHDSVLREELQVTADLLCLSTGVEADPSAAELGAVFGVPLTPDGFFQEADAKWRPVDFLKEGIFLAGTAHSPRPIAEVMAQAEAAAQRAFTYLSKQSVTTARVVSAVHDAICSRCRTCVTVCPFDARSFDEVNQRVVVNEAACQGCGMCATACPNNAAEVLGCCDRQQMAVIEAELANALPPVP
jgi:heterodisulfide reductase subunit A2